MANQSFSQSVTDFRTMSSGISTRLDAVAGVGITADDATAMSGYADQLDTLNAQQEELKAQLKAKTEALNTVMKEARAKNSELSKRIKIVVPQEEWLAFGITAKR